MDVALITARLRSLLFSLVALMLVTACNQQSLQKTEAFHKTTASCVSTAVAKQYVVRWKDGTTTIHKNTTEEELLNDVVLPNESEIDIAEQDQKIRIGLPVKSRLQTEAVSTVEDTTDWGQDRVEASSAWTSGQIGTGVVVAVIDSGVQRTHPQLKNAIYVNPGESGLDDQGRDKSSNGVDDDSNGFVDDVSGYDFALNSPNVGDTSGHGTHVSGIIAADSTQGRIKGIAPGARILPLDFMVDGSGNISDAIRAMNYAVSRGAKVINASWGGAPCSATLQKAIDDAGRQGVLFVAASGNSGDDLDSYPEYPAAFNVPTQITVGASMYTSRSPSIPKTEKMAVFSNYSYDLVHIMAPGVDIVSTYPQDTTVEMDGTSMAAPFVSGAAAILFSVRPNATPLEVKNALLNSADSGPFKVSSRGRLNIRKALLEIEKLPE